MNLAFLKRLLSPRVPHPAWPRCPHYAAFQVQTAMVVDCLGGVYKCEYKLIDAEFSTVLFNGRWRIVKTNGEGDDRYGGISQWFNPANAPFKFPGEEFVEK